MIIHKPVFFEYKNSVAGGKRYVPLDIKQSESEVEEVRDRSRAYEKRFGDYFRTDLRIGFKWNGKNISQEMALDLQNIFNYQSVFMEMYDKNKNEVYPTHQQGFIPKG